MCQAKTKAGKGFITVLLSRKTPPLRSASRFTNCGAESLLFSFFLSQAGFQLFTLHAFQKVGGWLQLVLCFVAVVLPAAVRKAVPSVFSLVFKMSDSHVLFNGNFSLEILSINYESL